MDAGRRSVRLLPVRLKCINEGALQNGLIRRGRLRDYEAYVGDLDAVMPILFAISNLPSVKHFR